MDEYRDEGMDGWQADLEQAQASIRDTVPMIAAAYQGLRAHGLGHIESCDLAGAWFAAISRVGE